MAENLRKAEFEIPQLRIDPTILPPPLDTSQVGSFAYNTLKVRVPRILRETIATNTFAPSIRRALEELHGEIVSGRIRELREPTPDRDFWNTISSDHIGQTWLDVPWYWAEAYFYRRVLEATRFFENDIDPYAPKKALEWESYAAPRLVENILRELPDDTRARFEFLLLASLWGNRTDLSYNVGAQFGQPGDSRDDLLMDDSRRLWEFFGNHHPERVVVIADNAGTELSMDLAFIDFLLTKKLTAHIDLHLKPQPFFVSDAMLRDVQAGLHAIESGESHARALATGIRHHLAEGHLRLHTHWFYTTCLHYFQLPDDLFDDLHAADLIILKGDANYRRLLGDAQWAPTASFQDFTAYFPARFVSLRTLKAELIVGLPAGAAEKLDAIDPGWRVNGKRGVVQGRF